MFTAPFYLGLALVGVGSLVLSLFRLDVDATKTRYAVAMLFFYSVVAGAPLHARVRYLWRSLRPQWVGLLVSFGAIAGGALLLTASLLGVLC